MRVLGAHAALALLAMPCVSGCIGGADDDPTDVIIIGHDMAPDPDLDAEVGVPPPRDGEVGVPRDDVGPDGPPPRIDGGVCPAPDGVLPGDAQLTDRAWRIDLPRVDHPGRLDPGCGGGDTGGAEASVRFIPQVDGEHLVVISGRYSALYHTPPCGPDAPPEIDACVVVDGPFAEGATRARWLDLRAGEAIELVADAPAGERAGPLAVLVYPPVPEGSSCAPIGGPNSRLACRPGLACVDDVCRYDGPPIPGAVRAWSDHQSLRVEVEVADEDVVEALWARIGGDDRGEFVQLQTILVAFQGERLVLQGFVEDPALAEADAVDIELIDADGRIGRGRADVAELAPRPEGDRCDPDGMRDVCVPGGVCVAGRCRVAAAHAWATERGPNVLVELLDAPAEPMIDAVVREAPAEPDDRWRPLLGRPAEVGRRWIGVGLDLDGPSVQLRIQQPGRPPGLPVIVPLEPLPIRAPGQACDLEGVADRCPPALACLPQPDEGRCVEVDPPRILNAQGWYGPAALGLKVAFSDPQDDAALFEYTVWDRRGLEMRYALPAPLPLPADAMGLFIDSFDAEWGPRAGDVMELVLIDAQGLRSDPARVPLAPAPEVDRGEVCDPRGALSVCAERDDICAAVGYAPPRCAVLEAACPDGWNPFPIVAPGRHDDNHRGGPDRTAGVCGGVGTPEAIYEVVARETTRWRVSVQPPGSTVYVRTHCAFAVAEAAEIACADEAFDLPVRRGQTYYFFVDGPGAGNPFTLQIE